MTDSNSTFLRANLDKFLLLLLVFTFTGVGIHASHHADDINSGYSQFVQQSSGLVLGALLTLLTMGSKKGQSGAQAIAEAREDIQTSGGAVTEHRLVDVTTRVPGGPPPTRPPCPRSLGHDMVSVAIPIRSGGAARVTLQSLARIGDTVPFEVCLAHDDGRGANWARNKAASMARYEFILFSDDDIEWLPGSLDLMWRTLDAHPEASYCYGSWQMVGGPRDGLIQCAREFNGPRLRLGNYISTMSLMRRAHFPGFDEELKRLVDWELYLRMWLDHQRAGVYCGGLTFRTRERAGITSGGDVDWRTARNLVAAKHGLDWDRPKRGSNRS